MIPCKHAAVPCAACVANRARVKAWYEANKPKHHRRCRKWARKNKKKRKAVLVKSNAKRRYRKRELKAAERATAAGCTAVEMIDIWAIYHRDDGMCWLCGQFVPQPGEPCEPKDEPTLDHIIPKSWTWGPGHIADNVNLAHKGCNSRKGTRLIPEVDVSHVPF